MELSVYLFHSDKTRAVALQKFVAAVLFQADYRASVFSCSDAEKLTAFLKLRAAAVDILFLPAGQNGYALGKLLRTHSRNTTLVFFDGTATDMPDAFCMLPISYMTPDCDKQHLAAAVLTAATWAQRGKHVFHHESRTDLFSFDYAEIDYFESNYRVVNIHLKDGSVKTITAKLNDIQAQLPGEIFCRVHQSYLVNLTQIARVDKTQKIIHFLSGASTYASKAGYPVLMESMTGGAAHETL